MHSICLGVIKRLFFFWFSSTLDKKYCLKNRLEEINNKFINLKPPDYIKTIPRDLNKWSKWKAYEFLNFLLFYSLPVFHNIMNDEHYSNLIKFVVSLEILLGKNIPRNKLDSVRNLLREFVSEAEILYSKLVMYSGFHELLHLVDLTIEIGPLNAISCFTFEELNRKFIRLIKGFNLIGEEFCKLFTITKILVLISLNYKFSSQNLHEFYNKHCIFRTSNRKNICFIYKEPKLSFKLNKDNLDLDLFYKIVSKANFEFRESIKNIISNIELFERYKFNKKKFTTINISGRFDNSNLFHSLNNEYGRILYIIRHETKVYFICQRINFLYMPYFDTSNREINSKCFLCDVSDEYFTCNPINASKVFLMQLSENLSFLNFFKSSHLFS